MKSSLSINGKEMLSIKAAAEQVPYSKDYITRLSREGKIVATHIGRNWYVDISSLKNYELVSNHEQEIRKRRLSEERKNDLKIKEIKKQKDSLRERRVQNSHKSASMLSGSVLVGGLLVGFWLNGVLPDTAVSNEQLASVNSNSVKVLDIENVNETVAVVKDGREVISAEFSHETNRDISSLADSGLFLLPRNQNGEYVPSELFSDEVVVMKNDVGKTVLRLVDADGIPYGEEIPFIEVPVNQYSP